VEGIPHAERNETGVLAADAKVASLKKGEMYPRKEAYIVEIDLAVNLDADEQVLVVVHGETDRGHSGMLEFGNPTSPAFRKAEERNAKKLSIIPAEKEETRRSTIPLHIPYQWTFDGGADLTVEVRLLNEQGERLEFRKMQFRVPPPPPFVP